MNNNLPDAEALYMSGVQSIERAFAILRELARGSLGVTEIADRTELPKSTVSRLLATLEAEGAVEQMGSGGGYCIGQALATISGAASPTATLRATVRPFIEALAMQAGGSAGFTVRDGREAYWVDNVESTEELVLLADQTGQTFPLHAIPSGIALLARMTADDLEGYLSHPLEALHEHTMTDAGVIRDRVGRVDADGLVISREEIDAGVNAFAAAFRGPAGDWVGALYVQGPSFRFPGDRPDAEIGQLVVDAANDLSAQLHGR